jgi:uncharacterized membrane protein YphA (DoxX/SURF4 family)
LLAASTVADLARIVLGTALLVAGVVKIAAGSRWVDQTAALAVPRPIATAMPWVELAIAAPVIAGVAEPWPAAIAVALLAAFTGWIIVHLARGEHPPCACFGSLSTSPLSWWHVARNGLLMLLGFLAVSC